MPAGPLGPVANNHSTHPARRGAAFWHNARSIARHRHGAGQPEETRHQIGRACLPADGTAPAGVTRVLPQSDDGAVLYLQEPRANVGKRSAVSPSRTYA